ncbi:MAG: ABC transporter substrate-binding protein [Rhodobacteraceae bacterium]|nr:ABC transporter substrate-binding protein [Paracoccaceae bacterium]
MPKLGVRARKPVCVGLLTPLTGDAAAWGLPGLNGCKIWADWLNESGGLKIGDQRRQVEIVAFDDHSDPARAVMGVKHLVLEQDVKFILMLGGDTVPAVADFLNRYKMLASTNVPSDLGPDTPYLIAPCECHPMYVATGVDWLAENRPHLKTVSICAQKDLIGLPSMATYRAAFKVAGINVVKDIIYPGNTHDMDGVVDAMLEPNPDILCWGTSYEPFVHALTQAAYHKGFTGQILSCTVDNYHSLIGKTDKEFMEGTIFHFPDFDDPALDEPGINFPRPAEFFAEYNRRYPGEWSTVSWVYCSVLEMWRNAVERIQTVDPVAVLWAMKLGGFTSNIFGEAQWWGEDFFGINHSLISRWPVVEIHNGKARIVEFRSVLDWCQANSEVLMQEMRSLGQMWDQRYENA